MKLSPRTREKLRPLIVLLPSVSLVIGIVVAALFFLDGC